MCMSSSKEGLAVVRSFSPAKMELAPAMKHRAWSERDMSFLPALSLTTLLGMMILAVAIIRSISSMLTFWLFSRGVPFTGTNALIGTESGCLGSVERVWSILMRSSLVSPSPMMPPLHTVILAFRTFSRVLRRSSKVRVVMILS